MPESTGIVQFPFLFINVQTSIERLSAGLAKTTEGEEQLRKRVNDLGKNISTKDHQTQDLQVFILSQKQVTRLFIVGKNLQAAKTSYSF